MHGRYNPSCETVVAILRLTECGDLLSKDGEDILRGITVLKAGKERMRCQVFLNFAFVRFQSGVEDGRKVGLAGGCGLGGGS